MDGISLTTPILFLYSDGGPDHRSTYWSVQLAYILLFISLDLDLLVTARTAPSHSYYNPAERCMSILNLALQNVSLERCAMLDDQEFRVKSRSTMKARRDIALRQGDMKDALIQSVEPVITNVKARFGRLKYQEEGVRIHDAAKDEEIDAICSLIDLFRDIDKPEPVTLNDVKNRNSLKKFPMLQQFVERHTRSRQYSFQVKKCKADDCFFCAINPHRLDDEKFEDLHWLPDPVLSEDACYKPFEEVYGTDTKDNDRPSLKDSCQPTERDKKHHGLLNAAAARSFMICYECGKRRVIYCKTKLGRPELNAIERVQEQLAFSCGSQLFPAGPYTDKLVCREGQNCKTPIEVAYYSAKTVKFVDICFHCGDVDLYDGDIVHQLKEQYSIVRPICNSCVHRGVRPAVRNALKVAQRHA